ncbi:MAG: hypothetical protein K1X87_01925 [Dehalococcoidia bacterium]|nr:hypothetical protein [Dehalococcoidia bacterium]
MNLDFAFLCDSAQEGGGKVHALGIGFDTINAAQVPVTYPLLTIVVQLRYSIAEAGDKSISIRLIDADGRDIVTPVAQTVPFPAPEGARSNAARLIVAFGGVNFATYGDYAAHVTLNGSEVASLPIVVLPASAPA